MSAAPKSWAAGDLAVCLRREGWWNVVTHEARNGPVTDDVVRVRTVWPLRDGDGEYCGIGLEFEEYPDDIYAPQYFRKVDPDHAAADDAEIVALIQRASARASV